jgi:hypothetical protein
VLRWPRRCPLPPSRRAGVLYAASLWLSNSAYLYLSVSFIQMTKSLMPGLVYACGVALGTEQYQVGPRHGTAALCTACAVHGMRHSARV